MIWEIFFETVKRDAPPLYSDLQPLRPELAEDRQGEREIDGKGGRRNLFLLLSMRKTSFLGATNGR
jgi:hypothetical protein